MTEYKRAIVLLVYPNDSHEFREVCYLNVENMHAVMGWAFDNNKIKGVFRAKPIDVPNNPDFQYWMYYNSNPDRDDPINNVATTMLGKCVKGTIGFAKHDKMLGEFIDMQTSDIWNVIRKRPGWCVLL